MNGLDAAAEGMADLAMLAIEEALDALLAEAAAFEAAEEAAHAWESMTPAERRRASAEPGAYA